MKTLLTKFNWKFGVATLAMSSMLLSCGGDFSLKSDQESNTKTLDNLASSKLHPNQCSPFGKAGKRKVIIKEDNIVFKGVSSSSQKSIKNEVYKVMGNIPQSVLTIFFALDGKVEINSKTSSICRELLNSRREQDASQYTEADQLVSCWKRDGKGSATIYIDPKATVTNGSEYVSGINHGLIRSFGYILSEMFLALDIKLDDQNDHKWQVTELLKPKPADQEMLETLSESFVADVEASSGRYNLKKYQSLMDGTESEKQKFRYFVFAESFDSYHCSKKTRDTITRDFPKTYKAMKTIVATLNQFDQGLVDKVSVANNTNLTSNSLALHTVVAQPAAAPCGHCMPSLGTFIGGVFEGLGSLVVGVAEVI